LIAHCVDELNEGCSLVVFPEGTRTIPGKPVKFQRGVAAIALQSGASILPVTLGCSPTTLTKREKWYEIPPRKFILSLHVGHDIDVGPIDENAGRSLATRSLTRQLEQYFIEQLAHHEKS
jgi:1-acyl-sn-glycerol-3-phosphate acyltransferase